MLQTIVPAIEWALSPLVHAAWQAALLAAAVLALTWLCGSGLAPRWRFALWLIVLARLALPVIPAAPWSAFQIVAHGAEAREEAFPKSTAALPAAQTDQPPEAFQSAIPVAVSQIDPPAFAAAEKKDLRWSLTHSVSTFYFAVLVWMSGVVALLLRYIASSSI